jgi:hypothetical protein
MGFHVVAYGFQPPPGCPKGHYLGRCTVCLGTRAHRPCFDLSVCLQPVCLSPVCPSLFCRSDWLANPIACASFRCLKICSIFIRTSRLAPYPAQTPSISVPCLLTTKMVSASSSRAPRASQNPALELPRFTHVTGKNGASIPIAKASKQELVAGLEQYSRRHGEYPDSYPGGPQDLSDSDNESSGDELRWCVNRSICGCLFVLFRATDLFEVGGSTTSMTFQPLVR